MATWSKICQMCTVHLPVLRTDKAEREYDGLSAGKGIEVIVPRMKRPSVPEAKRLLYFLHCSGKSGEKSKKEGNTDHTQNLIPLTVPIFHSN